MRLSLTLFNQIHVNQSHIILFNITNSRLVKLGVTKNGMQRNMCTS
jgi:hypothetical protein